MKPNIPKRNRDLVRYVRRKRWGSAIAYAVWIGIFALGAWYYNSRHQIRPTLIGWRLAAWMGFGLLSGFLIFRIRKLFCDRNFEGKILKRGLSHTYTSSDDPGKTARVNYDFRLHTYLIVKTGNGKKKRIRFEQKPGFYLYYYEGSHLFHFAGLPYPVCDPCHACRPKMRERDRRDGTPHDDLSVGYICAACGNFAKDPSLPCPKCGHSIIDPAELSGGKSDRMAEEKKPL